ncbi:MAG: hypothetical protein WDN26_00705 [Chitinophagaceae bacterium]
MFASVWANGIQNYASTIKKVGILHLISAGIFMACGGDFDVNISIDKNYIIGATGELQNANQVGYGYETAGDKSGSSCRQ